MSTEERMSLQEAQDNLKIDKDALDEVCLTHAELFGEVADRHTRAVSERDFKKDAMSTVSSEVESEIRSKAAEKGDKITEKAITAQVLLSDEYLEANEEYLNAKKAADLWANKKEAFMQKSSMIKRLCDLYLAGYYTTSSVKGAESAGDEIGHDNDRKAIRKSRRRKRS